MSKVYHEIRDPIHVFICLNTNERNVLDSLPIQRLRHIHQLALSYLVYPGATHKRFEHSLGVMELAGRVFDTITRAQYISDPIRELLPELEQEYILQYWRRVLRMAALCHDIGHLPFSHAAEKDLLPTGWNHEKLTRELITSSYMLPLWNMQPPLDPIDIVKLALGPRKASDLTFTYWETLLSEVIVGDWFGVDRMDYLLRDSHHLGVAYGKFDHYRLIDTLRILIDPDSKVPALGVEEGGIQSAEALILARYFMYSQVYFHPVRRAYDHHLCDFMRKWLNNGMLLTDLQAHLLLTDNEVNVAIREANENIANPGHDAARRIMTRQHFKVFYQRNPNDIFNNPNASLAVYNAAKERFGTDRVHQDKFRQKSGSPIFPVLMRDGRIVSSLLISNVLENLPIVAVDNVYIDPALYREATNWLHDNRSQIILAKKESMYESDATSSIYSQSYKGTAY